MKHGRATFSGVSFHDVEGCKTLGPPIILLHGFPQSWMSWRMVIPQVARRSRVVAVDLRGYGDSGKPTEEKGDNKETMATDIRALADHLGLDRHLLVGHDRGGRVARRDALDDPDAIAGAALLDIFPEESVDDHLTAGDAAEK